ncbi:hypothetical protein [Aeoliella sp. SH292]|uniref:hypothetical protein n=1 Tax=Aeoliella sp. SH292 TaxID=3454464 RepID=UPI003F97DF27
MRTANCFLIAATLCLAGCQTRFLDQQTIDFAEAGEISTFVVPPTTGERTLQVSAKSNNAIDVYVYLEENQEEAERMITLEKPSDLVLAMAENTTAADLTAKIVPNKSACVMIKADSGGTKVELKMND